MDMLLWVLVTTIYGLVTYSLGYWLGGRGK